MPTPPVPISRQRQRRARLWDEAETPSKLPRPWSRRFNRLSDTNPFGFVSPGCPEPADHVGRGGFPLDLPRSLLAEILAQLDAEHILRAASVCSAWLRAAQSGELWTVATPRLGLADRVVHQSSICTRRSRGSVVKGTLLGTKRQEVALRTFDVKWSNANHFDGLLPTVVREVSFLHTLNRLQHPGIVRMVHMEVKQNNFFLATEWLPFNFSDWFERALPRLHLQEEIRSIHRQVLEAVDALHSHGIFHRNLKPHNVLVDKSGRVKLCDFAHGRGLDAPLLPYTPQESNERDMSSREMAKRNYLAPERILRKEVYGSAVDIWSIGCLMAEAALQQPLFCAPNDASEVQLLFRIFRFLGTPGPDLWPEAMVCKNYSVKFPIYKPFDLQLAGRMGGPDGAEAAAMLMQELLPNRSEVFHKLIHLGQVLEAPGMELLSSLLTLDPQKRCSARQALQSAFLHGAATRTSTQSRRRSRSKSPVESGASERRVRHKSQHSSTASSQISEGSAWVAMSQDLLSSQSQATPATALARILSRFQLGTPDGPRTAAPHANDSYWPPLWAEMARQDLYFREAVMTRYAEAAQPRCSKMTCQQVDRMLRLCLRLKLLSDQHIREQTLHLAVALLHDFTSLQTNLDPELAELACVKLAESMNEVSHEYYKLERSDLYAQAQGRWSRDEILRAEHVVFERLQSRLQRPTAAWFLHSALAVGGGWEERVRNLAYYINTLALYDAGMQEQPASTRAQVALLLAVYSASNCSLPGHCSSLDGLENSGWNKVRSTTCWSNSKEIVMPVFTRMCHLLTIDRFRLEAEKLNAVDERYPTVARSQLPKHFPCTLADELLLPLLQHCLH